MTWLLRTVQIAGAVLLVLLLAGSPVSAKQSGKDAAGCLALIGGPTGQLAAQLAKGDSVGKIKGDWEKASATAVKYGEKSCEAFVQDYVFLAIAAALTALVADEQLPNDYDDAKTKLDGLMGQIIASLLADPNSPLAPVMAELAKLMGPVWMENFNKALDDPNAKQAVADMMTELKNKVTTAVPILALFLSYFDCALVVATGGAADQAKQTIENYTGCAEFLATCSQSLADCVGGVAELGQAIAKGIAGLPAAFVEALVSVFNGTTKAVGGTATALGEYVNCQLAGKCLVEGVQQEQTNFTYPPCAAGWMPGVWYQWQDASGVTHTAIAAPACVCGPTPDKPPGFAAPGMTLIKDGVGGYACGCADQKQGYQSGGVCATCANGQVRCDGTCGPPDAAFSDNFQWNGTKSGNKVKVSLMQDGVCKKHVCVCGKGDKPIVDAATGTCACGSTCQPGSIYPPETSASLDPTLMDAKQCKMCPANHKAVQDFKSGALTSLAFETMDKCEECAGNEKSSMGSAQCVKLSCPYGFLAKDHQCIKCAGGKCAVAIGKPDPASGPPPLRKRVHVQCPVGMEMQNGKCRMPKTEAGQPGLPGRKGGDEIVTNPANVRGKREILSGATAPVQGNQIQGNQIKGTPVLAPRPPGLTGTPALVQTPAPITGTPALVNTPSTVTGPPTLGRTPTVTTVPSPTITAPKAPSPLIVAPPTAPTLNRR